MNLNYIILQIFARVCSGPQQKGQLAHQFKCSSANLGYCILHCMHANQHVQLRGGDLQTTALRRNDMRCCCHKDTSYRSRNSDCFKNCANFWWITTILSCRDWWITAINSVFLVLWLTSSNQRMTQTFPRCFPEDKLQGQPVMIYGCGHPTLLLSVTEKMSALSLESCNQ